MLPLCCPACAESLSRATCADPRAACLSCQNGHRYFVPPASSLADQTASAAAAQFPALRGKSSEEIAAFWLSDPRARSLLNEQLAELLCTILDARTAEAETPSSYCPICARPMAEYEQPDAWVRGLRCSRGHTWALRGGRLGGGDAQAQVVLRAELTNSVALGLVRGWLNENPYLSPQLHESVAGVLKCWRDGVVA